MIRRQRCFFVYVLSNFKRNVLYIGVTSNLLRRVWEHKEGIVEGFTNDYQVHDLLYFETYDDPQTAIAREKRIKNWTRRKKNVIQRLSKPLRHSDQAERVEESFVTSATFERRSLHSGILSVGM